MSLVHGVKRNGAWGAVLVSLALVLTACASAGTPAASNTPAAVKAPTFAAGTTMARIQKQGYVTIGTKYDQPLFGIKDPASGRLTGFDTDIAREIARGIFGNIANIDSKIRWVEAVTKNREVFLQEGKIDFMSGTYSITDARKQVVDFAGPYYQTGEDAMILATDNTIKSVTDLNGKKACSAQGSTSIDSVKKQAPQVDLSLTFDTYTKCAQALADGRVQAVATDEGILAGLVIQSKGKFKLMGNKFTTEDYGIGVKKGDTAFRTFINDVLDKIAQNGTWTKLFTANFSVLKVKVPTPPTTNRY